VTTWSTIFLPRLPRSGRKYYPVVGVFYLVCLAIGQDSDSPSRIGEFEATLSHRLT